MADTDDPEALSALNVQYAAVLRHYLGDDFDTVLDDTLVTKRDGTVVFLPPPDVQAESAGDDEAAGAASTSPAPSTSETPDDAKDTTTTTAKSKPKARPAPSPFAGRQSASTTNFTPEAIDAMSLKEFMTNREAIYKQTLEGADNG